MGLAFHFSRNLFRLEFVVMGFHSDRHVSRVTTCLENLEMSGNYTDVREMSGFSLKIMEMSGNCQRKNLVMKIAKNFHNCINRLFSSTHLVFLTDYFDLYLCYILVYN